MLALRIDDSAIESISKSFAPSVLLFLGSNCEIDNVSQVFTFGDFKISFHVVKTPRYDSQKDKSYFINEVLCLIEYSLFKNRDLNTFSGRSIFDCDVAEKRELEVASESCIVVLLSNILKSAIVQFNKEMPIRFKISNGLLSDNKKAQKSTYDREIMELQEKEEKIAKIKTMKIKVINL